jgi:hypothetical protein
MRDYRLFVPQDCVAAESAAAHRFALDHMKTLFKADLRRRRELTLGRVRLTEGKARACSATAMK